MHLAERLQKNNLIMSCYVDDIVLSGKAATQRVLNEARMIIRKQKLRSNPTKEKIYNQNDVKLVTGVIATDSEIRLPNHRHKQIHDELKSLRSAPENIKDKLISRLYCLINAAGQIDPKYKKT